MAVVKEMRKGRRQALGVSLIVVSTGVIQH